MKGTDGTDESINMSSFKVVKDAALHRDVQKSTDDFGLLKLQCVRSATENHNSRWW